MNRTNIKLLIIKLIKESQKQKKKQKTKKNKKINRNNLVLTLKVVE